MRLEVLSRLDPDSERLLRERALLRAQDPDLSVCQMQDALLDRRLDMVCLYDDVQQARGLAGWRWQDEARSYAQVLLTYLQPGAPAALGGALADYVFSELQRAHSLEVIEARMRDQSPGVREAWSRHGVTFFERCRMLLTLGQVPVPLLPIPDGYHLAPWTDERHMAAEALMLAAHAESIDAAAAPNSAGRRLVTALRRLRSGAHGRPDAWCTPASLLALDARGRVVGCLAVSSDRDRACLIGLAVDQLHRRRGVARLLVLRSLGACAQQGCTTVSAAVTTRNPVRGLLIQIGFQAADCGEVALWWRDGRHHAWRE